MPFNIITRHIERQTEVGRVEIESGYFGHFYDNSCFREDTPVGVTFVYPVLESQNIWVTSKVYYRWMCQDCRSGFHIVQPHRSFYTCNCRRKRAKFYKYTRNIQWRSMLTFQSDIEDLKQFRLHMRRKRPFKYFSLYAGTLERGKKGNKYHLHVLVSDDINNAQLAEYKRNWGYFVALTPLSSKKMSSLSAVSYVSKYIQKSYIKGRSSYYHPRLKQIAQFYDTLEESNSYLDYERYKFRENHSLPQEDRGLVCPRCRSVLVVESSSNNVLLKRCSLSKRSNNRECQYRERRIISPSKTVCFQIWQKSKYQAKIKELKCRSRK